MCPSYPSYHLPSISCTINHIVLTSLCRKLVLVDFIKPASCKWGSDLQGLLIDEGSGDRDVDVGLVMKWHTSEELQLVFLVAGTSLDREDCTAVRITCPCEEPACEYHR